MVYKLSFVKKYLPSTITLLIIMMFFIALFYSIYSHIDGLGIFSIIGGIIFFSFMLYGIRKNTVDNSGYEGETAKTNLPHFLKIVTSPMFIRLLPSLLTVIFSYLERHKDKLDKAASQELQKELQLTLNKFKTGFEKFEDSIEQAIDKPPNHKKTNRRSIS